jgi:hypothetical protein
LLEGLPSVSRGRSQQNAKIQIRKTRNFKNCKSQKRKSENFGHNFFQEIDHEIVPRKIVLPQSILLSADEVIE